MNSVELMDDTASQPATAVPGAHQSSAYLLELTLDWVIRRISSNCDRLLGRDPVSLIGEPLGTVIPEQALHDLRNLCARASSNNNVARAFGVRLCESYGPIDVAFQLYDGKVLFEAVSSAPAFGTAFGSVASLFAGLSGASGTALRDGAARRMRALTGHDRISLFLDGERWTSGRLPGSAEPEEIPAGCPPIVSDCEEEAVAVLPEGQVLSALMRAPEPAIVEVLRRAGTRSLLRIPFERGEFVCECSRPRAPSFELHAAAELFAQMFALRLQADRGA